MISKCYLLYIISTDSLLGNLVFNCRSIGDFLMESVIYYKVDNRRKHTLLLGLWFDKSVILFVDSWLTQTLLEVTGWILKYISSTHHVILVLQEDGQFFEEWNHQDQQLLVIPFKNFDQQTNDVFIPHLQLRPRVFSKVQQEVKRHWETERVEDMRNLLVISQVILWLQLKGTKPKKYWFILFIQLLVFSVS